MTRPLGERQLGVLHCLHEHGRYPGTGWTWSTESVTVSILQSLAKRGLVHEELGDVIGRFRADAPLRRPSTFTINPAGLAAIQPELDRRAEVAATRDAERAAKQEREDSADRVLDETLERIRPQLMELGIHPDTVVASKFGRRGFLIPAETVETLIRYALEGADHA